MVTAVNDFGEGYKSEFPTIIITKSIQTINPSSLYVWGNNTNSEIGLTEELVE